MAASESTVKLLKKSLLKQSLWRTGIDKENPRKSRRCFWFCLGFVSHFQVHDPVGQMFDVEHTVETSGRWSTDIYMEDVHGLSTDRGFSWIFHICLSGTTGASSPESPESGLVHGTVRSVERKEWLRHQTHVVRQGYRVPDQGATHPGHGEKGKS